MYPVSISSEIVSLINWFYFVFHITASWCTCILNVALFVPFSCCNPSNDNIGLLSC